MHDSAASGLVELSVAMIADWWTGILFIPAGWGLVLLLARKSWRCYLELQQLADKSKYEYASTEHLPGE
jgi:hypothetical protein